MHHIVSDGWSMGVLRNELSVLYTAFLRGEDDPLPALEIQYADYAVWQRQWTRRRATGAADRVLERRLGRCARLAGTADRPSSPRSNRTIRGPLPSWSWTSRLPPASRPQPSPWLHLYMTLMAGWATLLSRLSGQTDIVIGTPVANRGRARDRKSDRLLRQYPGVAHRSVSFPEREAVARAGEAASAGGAATSGHPLRTGGRDHAAGSQPCLQSVVPGDVCLEQFC